MMSFRCPCGGSWRIQGSASERPHPDLVAAFFSPVPENVHAALPPGSLYLVREAELYRKGQDTMAAALHRLVGHLRRWSDPLRSCGPTDRQLLERFAARRDESAFAELVRRHGPMVLGVARRVLGDV